MPRASSPTSVPRGSHQGAGEPGGRQPQNHASEESSVSRFSVFCTVAPAVSPNRLLQALPDEPAVLWQPPTGPALLGLGEAGRVVASGPGRFAAVRQKATLLLARIEDSSMSDIEPVLLGGFAFSPDRSESSEWQVLGDALFRLPRWTYRKEGENAHLLGVIERDADAATVSRFTAERETLLALLGELANDSEIAAAASAPADLVVAAGSSDSDSGYDYWDAGTRNILEGIASGDLTKVVQARRQTIQLDEGRGVAEVLEGLAPHGPTATRFAIREGDTAFVGASPERLVCKRGLSVSTEALAGTAASGDQAALLRSGKDLREQQLVVHEIVRALRPLCARMEVPEVPQPRELHGLVHLVTPISGILREPCHVLDLVEALHPTPAVGGLPRGSALRWIDGHEKAPRGWYAAPFGWIDRHGDGDFVVALRSSLLEGGRAHLYAGAGIVEGSDPQREYAEVELKLETMRAAVARGGEVE